MTATPVTILLIDDEEDFINTLAERLELRGICTHTAFSGQQGLDFLERNSVDLVLLDMRMPLLSGLEVLREIRARHGDLPVMIITGHCSEQDRDEALALGVQGYYSKPVPFDNLLARLRLAHTLRGQCLQRVDLE